METSLLRWQDVLIICLNLAAMVFIGAYFARKNKSADTYFLAGRGMPGWVVGFSMMASVISSMTFLGMPAYTFKEDWRFMPAHFLYILPALLAFFVAMPFFRRNKFRSAYEYLEMRYSGWARVYTAVGFIGGNMFRIGVILYAVSLVFEQMVGLEMTIIIIAFGVVVAAYTIAGGLEAVIWTDLIQGISLMIGGLICLPIIVGAIPGGFDQIVAEAASDGKFHLGSTAFILSEKTMWVIILNMQFAFLQFFCTDQVMVQRYLSIKSEKDARIALALGTGLSIPVWVYFAFVGSALYVLFNHFPSETVQAMQPESVYPYFILTMVPAGVAGFVIAALLAAAMSTLDSSLNAISSTVVNDFFRRFGKVKRTEREYLALGRWLTVFFSAIMVSVALAIHFARTSTILELHTFLLPVFSTGVISLFLLGIFTTRVSSKVAAFSISATVLLVVAWLFLSSALGSHWFPSLSARLPDDFWIGVLPHLFLFAVAYCLSRLFPNKRSDDLRGLTVWTKKVT